ncbi:MAG: hypothetical protein EB141_08090 [Verrucomicrobia bacterium]|nr:hypothetical protein [Verrucomicrobiota bacterium]NBU07840.1 hypothetical protein [Pseudomonadota bacterium]NDA67531.1 hypothetical protein [Verrucomicrobiota bacterium]NDB75589.1 hypothetical protein [Verrucomicrobiota bacterium]NDD38596.1 hypothetical protein [Verrucomicrobiota bacterium]
MASDFPMNLSLRNWAVSGVALLALVVFSGCSTFNRDWQAAAARPTPMDSIEGRWEGRWLSDHNGHNGSLRALVRRLDNGQFETRYHATYEGVLSFGMQMNLTLVPTNGGWAFSGAENLGRFYGVYRYEGRASATNFYSTYKASVDHGTFQMTRPK